MGIAALIIGIVAVILGLVPACGLIFGLPPAIVGLILGIIDVKKKGKANQPKGVGLIGLILNVVAIIVIVIWTVIIGAKAKDASQDMEGFMEEMKEGIEQASVEMKEAATEAEKAAAEAESTE